MANVTLGSWYTFMAKLKATVSAMLKKKREASTEKCKGFEQKRSMTSAILVN